MAEIFVCTFLGLLLISLGCLAVKYPLLIGGYNTLSKFERSKIDIRPYALFMRKVTGIMGGSLIAGAVILHFMNVPPGTAVFLVLPVVIIGVGMMLKKAQALKLDPLCTKGQIWSYRIIIIIAIIILISLMLK